MERIGIIDIGSNSIRLTVYERTATDAYRVIDDSKESARLSERFDENGQLSENNLEYIANILIRFQQLCSFHRVHKIRTVATAAIRNAADRDCVVHELEQRTNLQIEVLSGEEESRLGFLGMINSMSIRDGFLVDIGGGSTEVTLFRNREAVRSVSFPFGAVTMLREFGTDGELNEHGVRDIEKTVIRALNAEAWISHHPGLPLVGLGGTMRCLCKMDQRQVRYSLPLIHNYQLSGDRVNKWLTTINNLKLTKRKQIDGLAKERADIIVPGLIILQTLFTYCRGTHFVVSGTGLRDGIFYEEFRPHGLQFSDVLEHSVQNILALHSGVSVRHVHHVERLAAKLFTALSAEHPFDEREGLLLHAAALLYKIGISIHYYNFSYHTFYTIAHSRIDGLTHREILLCALIASFKSTKRMKPLYDEHRDILSEIDFEIAARLGSLLQLAIALDRSGTQPIANINVVIGKECLHLDVHAHRDWAIERREIDSLRKEFSKVWGLKLSITDQ